MKSKQVGLDKLNTEMAKMYLQTLEKSRNYEIGDQVYVVIKDTKDSEYVFVESAIGPGIIPKVQLLDENKKIQVNIEEVIPAFYLGNRNGELHFTTVPVAPYTSIIFEKAREKKIPLKGTVEEILESGFLVRIGEEIAFCPRSKLQKEVKRGETLNFMVLEKGKDMYIVSHNDYLQLQKEQYKKELMEKLKLGSIVSGVVSKIYKNGCVVDLGHGIEAFLPLREITYKKIEDPHEVFKVSSPIRAKVITVDWKEDKILLSTKELEANPWLGTLPFKERDIVEVKVLNVKKNGIIVLLPEKFSGFIPVKEITLAKQKDLFRNFQKDQILKAMIIQIDKENQKILLSLKAVEEYNEQMEYKKYMEVSQKDEEGFYLGNVLFSKE